MSLKKIKISADAQVCTFCGSVHFSKEEATRNKCNKGEPKQKYKVGDIVTASFDVAAGMERIGSYATEGAIASIKKPSYSPTKNFKVGVKRGFGTSQSVASFHVPSPAHEWVYIVKPLKPHPEADHRINTQQFIESDIKPAQK